MQIINPTQLVDEFKKSGEFDRLRRELLSEFQRGDGISTFKARIEDIVRQRLASDQKLKYMPQESVHRELLQEMDRYPIVERAVADVRMLSDPSFSASIRDSVQRILREDGTGQKSQSRIRKDVGDEGTAEVTSKPTAIHPDPGSTQRGIENLPGSDLSPKVSTGPNSVSSGSEGVSLNPPLLVQILGKSPIVEERSDEENAAPSIGVDVATKKTDAPVAVEMASSGQPMNVDLADAPPGAS